MRIIGPCLRSCLGSSAQNGCWVYVPFEFSMKKQQNSASESLFDIILTSCLHCTSHSRGSRNYPCESDQESQRHPPREIWLLTARLSRPDRFSVKGFDQSGHNHIADLSLFGNGLSLNCGNDLLDLYGFATSIYITFSNLRYRRMFDVLILKPIGLFPWQLICRWRHWVALGSPMSTRKRCAMAPGVEGFTVDRRVAEVRKKNWSRGRAGREIDEHPEKMVKQQEKNGAKQQKTKKHKYFQTLGWEPFCTEESGNICSYFFGEGFRGSRPFLMNAYFGVVFWTNPWDSEHSPS